jgi:hypothetical protein
MKTALVAAAVLLSTVLGATVLREPIATAAAPIPQFFIANTADQPVPVTSRDDPARRVFAFFKNEQMAAGDAQHQLAVDVPAGKRLVIESISASAGFETADEEFVLLGIHARANGKLQDYFMSAEFNGRNPEAAFNQNYSWSATDTVRLYADGGTQIDVFWTRNTKNAEEANLNISIQGYLIDCTGAPCG